MASLLRSWARRAVRVAKDMTDVSPISATNAIVAEFQGESCVTTKWRSWSDAPHGGLSTCAVSFRRITSEERRTGWFSRGGMDGESVDGIDGDENEQKQTSGVMVLSGVLSTKTVAPLRGETKTLTESANQLADDPESLLTESETKRSGYEMRLAAVGDKKNENNLTKGFAATGVTTSNSSPDSSPDSSGDDKPEPLKMKRSGFAGASTVEMPPHEYLDLDAFTALRVAGKSDGRKYVVSLRTDNWITGGKEDLWQAFLFAPAGEWVNVLIPVNRFLKTWRGRVMEHEHEMNASKVTGIGIAVAGGGEVEREGPFTLEVLSITGLRLSPEALEMAKRREEAGWGIVSNEYLSQSDSSQSENDSSRYESDSSSTMTEEVQKLSVASEDLLSAARALRRVAEADRLLIKAASKPVKNTGLGSSDTKFKGEMLPEFLGRKPRESEE